MEIPADSLTRIKQKTIVQQVMEQVKDFVASGTLKPGDRLPTEIELARIFGVSRSSIREETRSAICVIVVALMPVSLGLVKG